MNEITTLNNFYIYNVLYLIAKYTIVFYLILAKEDELTTVKREVSQLRHGKKAAIEEYDQLREEYKRLKTELAQEKSGLPPAQTPQKQG